VVAAAVTVGVFASVHAPHYGGKSLSEWLKTYEQATDNVHRDVAAEAIRHIGTNAVPYLVEWAFQGPPQWMWKAPNYMRRLPRRFSNWWLRLVIARNKGSEGRLGFTILGAEVMVPALTNAVQNPAVRMAAMRSLKSLGGGAEPALKEMMTNDDPEIRVAATNVLNEARSLYFGF